MQNLVLGVFPDKNSAEDAMSILEREGYNPKDISILMREKEEIRKLLANKGVKIGGGTVTGVTAGAMVGGLAGLLASTVFPGLGVVFIGGPLAATIGFTGAAATTTSGALTGAVAEGLIGALTSAFGLSGEEAKIYKKSVEDGGILIAIPAKAGEEKEVGNIMSECDAEHIKLVEYGEEYERVPELYPSRDYNPAYYSDLTRDKKGLRWRKIPSRKKAF